LSSRAIAAAVSSSSSKTPKSSKSRYVANAEYDEDDLDYAPTVFERKKHAQAKRREVADRKREEKKVAAVAAATIVLTPTPGVAPPTTIPVSTTPLSITPVTAASASASREVMRSFKSRRESLFAKIGETDSVCDCQSFLIMLVPEREGAYFYGHPAFITKFFSTGISKTGFEQSVNVRPVRFI
jgi:hypothetical protein